MVSYRIIGSSILFATQFLAGNVKAAPVADVVSVEVRGISDAADNGFALTERQYSSEPLTGCAFCIFGDIWEAIVGADERKAKRDLTLTTEQVNQITEVKKLLDAQITPEQRAKHDASLSTRQSSGDESLTGCAFCIFGDIWDLIVGAADERKAKRDITLTTEQVNEIQKIKNVMDSQITPDQRAKHLAQKLSKVSA